MIDFFLCIFLGSGATLPVSSTYCKFWRIIAIVTLHNVPKQLLKFRREDTILTSVTARRFLCCNPTRTTPEDLALAP